MPTLAREEIEQLIKKLCAIPSVSGNAAMEKKAANVIARELKKTKSATGNSFFVKVVDCEDDPLKRKAVLALLKGGKDAKNTVLLTGHFDVVDAGEELSFDAAAYTKALKAKTLDSLSREDLASGNWLFGRGTMDMKAGLALFILALRELAKIENLPYNILFLAVPDEESDSAGMRGTIKALNTTIKENRLNVVAALTGEPCFWTAGENPVRPYYTGTTGKIMPYFMVLGKRAHVNDYAGGVNAALLISEIVSRMEGLPELIDGKGKDTLSPPACLAMGTRVGTYSVSLPECAYAYFNVLTVSKTPRDILNIMMTLAQKAAQSTYEKVDATRRTLKRKGLPVPQTTESILLLTFEKVFAKVKKNLGKAYECEIATFIKALDKTLDAREKGLLISEWAIEKAQIQGPAILMGFLPPFYPYRVNKNRNAAEKKLRAVIKEKAKKAGILAGDKATCFKEVFGGITDLSFLGFEGDKKALEALAKNMPGWGHLYSLPIEDLMELSIPIANMGPAGRDAHKATERLEKDFSYRVAPQLLFETIEDVCAAKTP